jgi:hypothetical protein
MTLATSGLSHGDWIDLAGALSALGAFALAIVTFLGDRVRASSRTALGRYATGLVAVAVLGAYTAACNVAAACASFAGAGLRTWLWGAFAVPGLIGGCFCVFGLFSFGAQVKRRIREGWEP